jgi:septum formation protein
MSIKQLILASQSPRRKQILQQIGIKPICMPVDIDESVQFGELASDYCNRLALAKAQLGWVRSDKKLVVLGSDTVVVFKQEILGKPKDDADALSMLMKLSNQKHQVITAVAIVAKHKQKVVESVSDVFFDKLDEGDVRSYIDSKEPMDKAGSYGIQGYASMWIKHISGSYSGIMGLPIYETSKLLREFE